MTDTTPPTSSGNAARRRFFWGAAIAAAVAALATGLGARALAHGGGHCGWQHGGLMGAALDPAALDAHLDRALKHLYVEIGATDAQKQQLAPIVKGAASDLLPLFTQMRAARRQAADLLSQERIDRAALETLRADHVKAAEQASRRFAQALADVAEQLTPEQRKHLTEHVTRGHHG